MKNNIQTVLAYGNTKNKIKDTDKMYTKVFDKTKVNVIFFECYLQRPIGFSGNINISYIIYSGNESLPEYKRTLNVSPEVNKITMGLVVVNKAGEHLVNGEYIAKIMISDFEPYYFDFTITGGVPKRFGLFKVIAKLAGL